MRKIEEEMIEAIEQAQGTEGHFFWSKANTIVHKGKFNNDEVQLRITLHGNCIAFETSQGWYINNCGWITPTTSSRLNALSTVIGSDLFHGVCIRKGSMYIRRGNQLVHMNNCCPV